MGEIEVLKGSGGLYSLLYAFFSSILFRGGLKRKEANRPI